MVSRRTTLVVLLLAAWFANNANAQLDRASLIGTVTDTSGAIVPHAKVEITSPNTGFNRQVESGDAGVYSITGLLIGTYDLRISHEGFQTFEQKGITLL